MSSRSKNDFTLPRRLVKDYESAIGKIIKRVLPPLGTQTFDQWLASIAARSREKDIQEASDWLARKMVQAVNVVNAKTWRQAAARSQQSQRLYRLLQAEMQGATGARLTQLVRENARYISSIPLEQAAIFVDEVKKAQQRGARPETIAKMARTRFPELLSSRVRLISRTETMKASSALTQARSEDVGSPCYIWETSRDGDRVRPSHRNMQGVVVFWNEAPSPEALIGEKSSLGHYHVGNCPNDRCTPIVVLTMDDIKFPARVYHHGAIRQMTKTQFKAIAQGLESRAA